MITSPVGSRSLSRNFRGLLLAAFGALALVASAPAAEAPKKNYDVPAADAVTSLKTFSEQSGEQIVYPVEQVRGVVTRPVKGEFSARAALDRMLEGTGLSAVQDEKTGALTVKRLLQKTDTGALKLETVTVLGSRIRQTESEGPSPVSTYDREFIDATGAMTLSDFLNRIPQTYSGIASGRGSAPDELNPEFGQRTETTTSPFNFVLGASDAPLGQTGVSGVSLRGLGAGSTLVLVDGRRVANSGNGNKGSDTRQGFVDLNTIPLGMIERVEVTTDGASAIYGADAVAGVINIILKKNYTGSELNGGYKATQHGGGGERNVSLTSGFSYGKLSGTVSFDYYDRQRMTAADRSFSKNQNHTGTVAGHFVADGTPVYGRDYRLSWGYPAVIQASGGVVSGTFDAIPGIRVVLVPTGSTTTPTIAQFIPVTTPAGTATVVNASAQRRANTASYLDLVPESERRGASGNFQYKFNDRIEAYASYRTSDTRGLFNSQPVTSITGGFGTPAVLPAAFNPFNQNVQIAMVLADWGSTNQRVRTLDDSYSAGLRGQVGTWQWDLGYSWDDQSVRQTTRNFNGAGFSGLLTNADPAKRFNPFIDFTAPGAPSQAALLETLSVYPELYSKSKYQNLDFSADGDLFTYRGGTVKLAAGGSTAHSSVWSRTTSYSAVAVPVATSAVVSGGQTTDALFGELYLPAFGKTNALPLLQRLDFQLAGRYEEDGSFSKSVPKYGVSWSPVKSVLIRGSWSQGFRAPSTTEYLVVSANTTTSVTDPLRTPTTTTGVVLTRGSNPNPGPETSDNSFLGLVYEPTFIKGLSLQVNYYDTQQKNTLQILSAQNIVNNEALFPDRVTRAAPTAADIALNQPGQITAVNQTFINFGQIVNRSMDITADYQLPWEQLGRFRLNVSASRNLESTRQLAVGQPPVVLDDDTAAPPKWKLNATVLWTKGSWNASAFLWYLSRFESNSAGNPLVLNNATIVYDPAPAVAKLDLRLGYGFKNGVWRGYGKGMRVNFGVSNVFDKKPPFSDTLWGFNSGLHSQLILGRTFELSFAIPL